KHTTAASAIFLQSTSPLFILLLAPLLLGEHATRRDIIQTAVMGAGLGLFFLGMDRPSATAPNPPLGNVLAAICAVTWAFTVMGYRWLAARGASVAAAAVAGNITAGIFALVMAQPLSAGRPADWAVVVFLGVCQLGIPYLFLARAVPQVRALEVGLFLLIEPVLNPIWAWLVHHETPGPATLVGGDGTTAGSQDQVERPAGGDEKAGSRRVYRDAAEGVAGQYEVSPTCGEAHRRLTVVGVRRGPVEVGRAEREPHGSGRRHGND